MNIQVGDLTWENVQTIQIRIPTTVGTIVMQNRPGPTSLESFK